MTNSCALHKVLFLAVLSLLLLGCSVEPQTLASAADQTEINLPESDSDNAATVAENNNIMPTSTAENPVQPSETSVQPTASEQQQAVAPSEQQQAVAPQVNITTRPAGSSPDGARPTTTTYQTDPTMYETQVATTSSGSSGRSALGTNLLNLNDYSQTVPFVDLMRTARPFPMQKWADIQNVEYDNQGWPIKLNGSEAVTMTHMISPNQSAYAGDYLVLYEGEGKMEYRNDAKIKTRAPGRDVVSFSPTGTGFLLAIVELNEKNPIRNIKIMMPGGICEGEIYVRITNPADCKERKYLSFADHPEKIRFNPDFLSYIKDFSSLRFMDWMGTTDSPLVTWGDNKTMDDATWSSYGIFSGEQSGNSYGAPIEVLVELSNLVGIDPWFTFPHLADDNYIRQFATYVKNNLSEDLKPYIEYSNEVWNGQFKQFNYVIEQGKKLGLDDNVWAGGSKFYSRRSVQIFKIWEDVYGGAGRFTRVLASHSAVAYTSNMILEYENAYRHADALAIAPYMNNHSTKPEDMKTLEDVFASLDAHKADWLEQLKGQAEVAKRYSVDLIAYEGGQHLVNPNDDRLTELYIAANRDPRMGNQLKWHMDEWKKVGGKHFVVFTSPGEFSKWGSWGLKEYLTQPRSEAPKYDALIRWKDENPKWW